MPSIHHASQFVDFLYSSENTLWNPERNQVYQSLDRPLAQYWINSSHNTSHHHTTAACVTCAGT